MTFMLIILAVLVLWCIISIPAFLISALGALGGNSPSKFMTLLFMPVIGVMLLTECIEKITRNKR